MKVNKVMQRYTDEIGASIKPLIDSPMLIQPRFMEWDGCILLDREKGKLPHKFVAEAAWLNIDELDNYNEGVLLEEI